MRIVSLASMSAACLAIAVLPGCVPVLVGGAAAGGYYAAQERGIGGTASDSAINAAIADKWYKYNQDMYSQLGLNVYDGRVVITGAVSNPEWRVEAVRLAWQVEGVKEVNSEIQVADKSTLASSASDTWITTRLRSAITFDSNIRSLNYNIETVNGVVYVMGSARSQSELDLVTNYARNIPNVKRVVSYVQIRSGEPNSPTPVASPGGTPSAAPSNAPNNAPAPLVTPAPSTSPAPSATPAPGAPSGGTPAIESRPLS